MLAVADVAAAAAAAAAAVAVAVAVADGADGAVVDGPADNHCCSIHRVGYIPYHHCCIRHGIHHLHGDRYGSCRGILHGILHGSVPGQQRSGQTSPSSTGAPLIAWRVSREH